MKTGWIASSTYTRQVHRRRSHLKLAVSVAQIESGRWGVIAIETPKGSNTIKKVLDRHSHKVVGDFPTPARAFTCAERYLALWAKGKQATHKTCGCGDIR